MALAQRFQDPAQGAWRDGDIGQGALLLTAAPQAGRGGGGGCGADEGAFGWLIQDNIAATIADRYLAAEQ